MTATAAAYDAGPIAFANIRAERAWAFPCPPGRSCRSRQGARRPREQGRGDPVPAGTRLHAALAAADHGLARRLSCTVADARFAKPLDLRFSSAAWRGHRMLVMVEDGAVGGFGSHVLDYVVNNGLAHAGLACAP